jgi:hypothetical protein
LLEVKPRLFSGSFSGRIRASGRKRGIGVHTILPGAWMLPDFGAGGT